ncbi:MAG: oligoendopeptidase F [Tissierellia bacterium]|nr:oligoendopeptidase F [Tissierellia bacterium]
MDSYNWDLSKIYSSEEQIENDVQKLKEILAKVDDYSDNQKESLLELLKLNEKARRTWSKLGTYAHMKRDEDSRVTKYQKMNIEMESLMIEISSKFAFVEPLILSLDESEIEEILNDDKYNAYKLFIEKILRYKAHTLSEAEESIMSKMSELQGMPGNDYYMLTNADMKFPFIESANEQLSNFNFTKLLANPNVEVRKETFEKYYETMKESANSIGSMLYGNMKGLIIESNIRNYNSSREMELYRDDVPLSVYDNLIDIVHEYLPYLYKYYEIKERVLKLEETHMYDVYLSITDDSDIQIPFDEAKEMVIAAVAPLGEQYQNDMRKAFDDNWIDVYPREGKRSGAYSSGCHDSQPYVLLNYTGNLDSVFTLIHELGHSMHSYYSRANNDFLYSRYTIFAAEVASTFNELLLLDYMLKNAKTDKEKILLLDHHINSFKGTVFRQTMFAEFERDTHKAIEDGKGLTQEDYSSIYYDLNKLYFGDGVVSDELISLEWARIPHFYSDYYVYKYATGFSAATILSTKVLNGEEGALERYLNFLKDGGNHFPIEQLQFAGADMSDPETLRIAFEVFKNKVDELENIYK